MAGKERIEDKIASWTLPITEELGLELVDVEWVKEGGHWFLRVFVDKETGVDLDHCHELSRRLDEILDREDPITQSYSLEVSSPGLERPLKTDRDFERFKGHSIRVTTFSPVEDKKEHIGLLVNKTGSGITIAGDTGEITLPLEQVASVRLYVSF